MPFNGHTALVNFDCIDHKLNDDSDNDDNNAVKRSETLIENEMKVKNNSTVNKYGTFIECNDEITRINRERN